MSGKPYENLKTIGIFNDSFPPIMDGVSLATQNYAYWMHKKGQQVCVVTPKAPHCSGFETPYPVYRYASIPIIGRKPYRLGLPDIDLALKTSLDQISFGLVHAHCPFSSGNIALRIAKEQKIPLIATFHSKYRDDFERSVHNKRIANLMIKEVIHFYEKADEVWIPQASVEETIREYGFKGRVEVVENGNDLAGTESVEPLKAKAKQDLNIKPGELVFLFVGQHIWEKNTRLIVESLARIKELEFKMFFIGTGYAADDMKQLVHELGLESKVEFVGVITEREQIKQYYAAADLFLFPSIYDNAPLVVREAAALQTPSVLINGATAAEIITDNSNGFLTENNVDAFSAKLRELASSPERIYQAGIYASRTIARSWEDIADEVLDRYAKIVQRPCKH